MMNSQNWSSFSVMLGRMFAISFCLTGCSSIQFFFYREDGLWRTSNSLLSLSEFSGKKKKKKQAIWDGADECASSEDDKQFDQHRFL